MVRVKASQSSGIFYDQYIFSSISNTLTTSKKINLPVGKLQDLKLSVNLQGVKKQSPSQYTDYHVAWAVKYCFAQENDDSICFFPPFIQAFDSTGITKKHFRTIPDDFPTRITLKNEQSALFNIALKAIFMLSSHNPELVSGECNRAVQSSGKFYRWKVRYIVTGSSNDHHDCFHERN